MDEEARFARSVGLSLGALWVAVIALRAITFTDPAAEGGHAAEVLARADSGTLPLVQMAAPARLSSSSSSMW